MDAEYERIYKKIDKDFCSAKEHIGELFEHVRQDPQKDDLEWLRKNLTHHCDLLTDMSTYLDDDQYVLSQKFQGEENLARWGIISNHAPIQFDNDPDGRRHV